MALAQPVELRGEVIPRCIRQPCRFDFLAHFRRPFAVVSDCPLTRLPCMSFVALSFTPLAGSRHPISGKRLQAVVEVDTPLAGDSIPIAERKGRAGLSGISFRASGEWLRRILRGPRRHSRQPRRAALRRCHALRDQSAGQQGEAFRAVEYGQVCAGKPTCRVVHDFGQLVDEHPVQRHPVVRRGRFGLDRHLFRVGDGQGPDAFGVRLRRLDHVGDRLLLAQLGGAVLIASTSRWEGASASGPAWAACA